MSDFWFGRFRQSTDMRVKIIGNSKHECVWLSVSSCFSSRVSSPSPPGGWNRLLHSSDCRRRGVGKRTDGYCWLSSFSEENRALSLVHQLFVHFMHLPPDRKNSYWLRRLIFQCHALTIKRCVEYAKLPFWCETWARMFFWLGLPQILNHLSYSRSKNMVSRSLIKKICPICFVDMRGATLLRVQSGSLYASFPHHSCAVGKDE